MRTTPDPDARRADLRPLFRSTFLGAYASCSFLAAFFRSFSSRGILWMGWIQDSYLAMCERMP